MLPNFIYGYFVNLFVRSFDSNRLHRAMHDLLCCAVPNPILRNVALNKPAVQISTQMDGYGAHAASLANDGSRQTDYDVKINGCSGSNIETNPWWAVDLGVPTIVCLVKLTNVQAANGIKLDSSVVCVFY